MSTVSRAGQLGSPEGLRESMQLVPLALLVSHCESVVRCLEQLRPSIPAEDSPFRITAVDGLSSDLQRVYAIERILMHLEPLTTVVQAEVADAIWNLLETIAVTYRSCCHPGTPKLLQASNRARQVGCRGNGTPHIHLNRKGKVNAE
jgi:hypothetical protein